MGKPIKEIIKDTDVSGYDELLGTEKATGITKNYTINEISDFVEGNLVIGYSLGYVDITWADLVILGTRDIGQKYNITDAHPSAGIIYGRITLITPSTFDYIDLNNKTNTITIQ